MIASQNNSLPAEVGASYLETENRETRLLKLGLTVVLALGCAWAGFRGWQANGLLVVSSAARQPRLIGPDHSPMPEKPHPR